MKKTPLSFGNRPKKTLLLILFGGIAFCLLFSIAVPVAGAQQQQEDAAEQQQTCDSATEGGACSETLETDDSSSNPTSASAEKGGSSYVMKEGICDVDGSSSSTDLYRHGGTAQAYKPNAPISNQVCKSDLSQKLKYKVASWPINRRSFRKGTSPTLDITLNLWSCSLAAKEDKCQCTNLADIAVDHAAKEEEEFLASSSPSPLSVVEIWQTKPDGLYSSLRPLVKGKKEECRAQVPVVGGEGEVRFTTVAPGSTGIMGGLGPGGWELIFPYGPPVIHLLANIAGHKPILLDVPILFHPKTLEERAFTMGDWRGASWVRPKKGGGEEFPIQTKSWVSDVENNKITIVYDVFLSQQQKQDDVGDDNDVELCQSWIYGLPKSFFLEPISMCGPSFLNFFAL